MALVELENAGDGVVVLKMANGKANVMDTPFLRELTEAFTTLAADDTTRAVVVTGAGSMFCAGVDLVSLLDGGDAYLDDFMTALSAMLSGSFRFPKPMVAAVNGHAIAGGAVLAACCDRRFMAEGKGRIGVPEMLVGVPFPLAAMEAVKFAVAPKQLSTVVLGGGLFQAEEAVRQGFADEAVSAEELMPKAMEAARALGAIPPNAFRITKAQLRQDGLARLDRDMEASDKEMRALWGSDECRGAIRRYVEKTLGK